MPTFISIALLGGIGGLISTLLPTGTDVPFPAALRDVFNNTPWWVGFAVHLIINVVIGAFAAGVLWAGTDPTAIDLTSTTIQPKQLATAAVVGLAGIGIAKKLQQQAIDAADWKASFKQAMEAAQKLKTKQPI